MAFAFQSSKLLLFFIVLMAAAVLTLSGDPCYMLPLAALMVVASWACQDIFFFVLRRCEPVRRIFAWPFQARGAERDLAKIMAAGGHIVAVAIGPALLGWLAGKMFVESIAGIGFFESLVFSIGAQILSMSVLGPLPQSLSEVVALYRQHQPVKAGSLAHEIQDHQSR